MRFFLIIVFKGDDSKLSKQNISITISGDLIVTHLIGQIKTEDVYEWFNGFEQVCQQFISEGRKYKLLVDRKGYTPNHFSVQKVWKEKFFNETILNHSKAIAFLLEEGEILKYLQQSNTKESVEFFDDYEQALNWLNEYPI
ncbi:MULTISPECIES: STAS/SEC14 domain-containing protein [Bacillus cereus group]|uniref:STAS/SEC14 domain-containing protein n=1 Tax=Bacillus cereus group TaxID=86661 RepID=UPI001CBA6033|nr:MULTISPECIES: STAS/SEC14 domain-containing protein [Bacillus cereus group]MCU4950274.1 STAS/SEC14 domain-containing protein [Bacillus paranthracis]MCU5286679.1 STAS/SEC14 domain-containing protein [Bacillus paranthracis]MDA1981282.1 STAS/SEC14 domain-containing protein [Bacillus cereus group sp. Bcc13]MDG0883506.1 STAS/SEC14 domain-containing protein [Bacillus paranthracis]MDG1638479.1 STAS/SEC14 domain-containing protein [Bacillus paranthracis]